MNRDIVTIGASAGGVEVMLELVRDLPAELAAAVFLVIHMPADYASTLPELLSKRGPLPARHPVHGEPVEPGTIYVAPNDMHMQLRPGVIEVVRGPKENGFRPAADVLFRTASAAYGPRVIGVVLSGYQDCGTAGMIACANALNEGAATNTVKRCRISRARSMPSNSAPQ
jgi:two-component system chemotaxis response regulator CheB